MIREDQEDHALLRPWSHMRPPIPPPVTSYLLDDLWILLLFHFVSASNKDLMVRPESICVRCVCRHVHRHVGGQVLKPKKGHPMPQKEF